MTIDVGTRLGQYVVGEEITSSGSGSWFEASEAGGLDRPVSVLATTLPDGAAATAVRERARKLASISDARLLPIYGQGEDGDVLWVAIRRVAGGGLSDLGRLDRRRAARLGAQLATQLAALEHEGIAPASVESGDVVVEGAGDAERAWLLPDPARPVAADAAGATTALVRLLDGLAGRRLLVDPPSAPQALADELGSVDSARGPRLRWVALAAVVVAVAVAAILAVVLGGSGGKKKASVPPLSTPAARITARIPVGDAVADLAAGPNAVWVTLGGGGLVRIDPKTNAVVGAPVQIADKGSFMGLVDAGDRLWAYGNAKLIRFDAATGRVETRTKLRKSEGLLALRVIGGKLWTTVVEGQSQTGRLVSFDPATLKRLSEGRPFGDFPELVGFAGSAALTVNFNNGTVSKVTAHHVTTVAAGISARGGTLSRGKVWVPTYFDRTLIALDPATMTISGVIHFPAQPDGVVAGAGSLWVSTASPARLYRVDPSTDRILGAPIALSANATPAWFALGSLWVDDQTTKTLLRLTPTQPVPAPQPPVSTGSGLVDGPIPAHTRLVLGFLKPAISLVAPPGLIAEGVPLHSVAITEPLHFASGLDLNDVTEVFGTGGRIVPVHSAGDFLKSLRLNSQLKVTQVSHVSLAGVPGLHVRIAVNPKSTVTQGCPGVPCVLVFPIPHGTYVVTKGIDDLTFVKRGSSLFLADVGYHDRADLVFERKMNQLVASIRFVKGAK